MLIGQASKSQNILPRGKKTPETQLCLSSVQRILTALMSICDWDLESQNVTELEGVFNACISLII